MAHDVFTSHSGEGKEAAGNVCAGLEARGLRWWIAPRDTVSGMPWGEALIDAMAPAPWCTTARQNK